MPQVVHRKIIIRSAPTESSSQKSSPSPPHPQTLQSKIKPNVWLILALMALTLAIYSPALKNNFTNWDDTAYIFHNPYIKHLDFKTLKNIFFDKNLSHRYWMGNYHPLTMLSLNISYALYHKDNKPVAWIFILTNIILHLLNVLLVFFFTLKITNKLSISYIVALLFAIHPLHVESVAWIAERKDVLYTFFYLLALLIYLKYIDNQKLSAYLLALFVFLLSLLSKGQAVSLSLSIVLLDWLKRRKLSSKLILEKIPFFALSLLFGLIAIQAQKYSNALETNAIYPLIKRIGIASYAYLLYIIKLLIPFRLAALYPYPDIIHETIPWFYYACLIPDLAVLAITLKWIKQKKLLPAFGILFFTLNIIFLLQLIPVGSAIFAERYSYIPSIGIFITIAWLLSKIQNKKIRYTLLTAYTIYLSVFTLLRVQIWNNSISLWEDTVQKHPNAVVAWNNLGNAYAQLAQNYQEKFNFPLATKYYKLANQSFINAINGKPDYANAYYNLSTTLYEMFLITQDSSYLKKALFNVNKAIAIKIDFDKAILQRGILYDLLGQDSLAMEDYKHVLQFQPNNFRALTNLGTFYGQMHQFKKSIYYFNRALKVNPKAAAAYSNRGLAYYNLNMIDSALHDFNKALEINPNMPSALYNRALLFEKMKKYNKALADINKAIKLSPNNPQLYFLRGNLYLYLKNKQKALKDLQFAAKHNYLPAIKMLKKNP